MKNTIPFISISSFALLLTGQAVTFSLEFQFGGSTSISNSATAYLVVDGTGGTTDSLTTISNYSIPGPSLSTGDMIGDYVVFNDALSLTDFGGGNIGFVTGQITYNTTSIDTDIVAGTDIGIVIVDSGTVFAYSGDDVANAFSQTGWSVPSEPFNGSLFEYDESVSPGSRLSVANDLVDISAEPSPIPEPSTTLLTSLGAIALISRRKR